jgi:hypothetical protein
VAGGYDKKDTNNTVRSTNHYFQGWLVVQWMSLNFLAMRWKFSFFKSFVDGQTMGECKGINLLFVSYGCKFAFLNIKNSIDYFMCAKNS